MVMVIVIPLSRCEERWGGGRGKWVHNEVTCNLLDAAKERAEGFISRAYADLRLAASSLASFGLDRDRAR